MNIIFLSICFSIFIMGLTYTLTNLYANKKCNSNYNKANDNFILKIDYPEYKVHAINEVCCSNKGMDIAEYVLWNFYLKDKDKVGHQELIIYDKIGKYNIGDILVFTKLEK